MTNFVIIGGGELRQMSEINESIVNLVTVEGRKPYILFLPQASSESKPYVNSFYKEFGSRLKCKATCALWRLNEMDYEHIAEKFALADIIYIGGGQYDVLITAFAKMNIRQLLDEAVSHGKIIAGNSAGAMLLFESAISDYKLKYDSCADYSLMDGYGYIKGTFCPHAEENNRHGFAERQELEKVYYVESNAYLKL